MKIKKVFFIIIPLLLSSCGTDSMVKTCYLAAKFNLKYAAYVPNYNVDMTPYFYTLSNRVDYMSYFDGDNSIFNYEVYIDEKGNPVGTGDYKISFKDSSKECLSGSFNYFCYYDGVYGGEVITSEDTKPSWMGREMFRMRYWWVRMEAYFPDICENKLILEFQYYEMNNEPPEFDHKIW